MVKAFFSANTPYFVTSPFTVKILHYCFKNKIIAPLIPKVTYTIANPTLEFQIPKWSESMP